MPESRISQRVSALEAAVARLVAVLEADLAPDDAATIVDEAPAADKPARKGR